MKLVGPSIRRVVGVIALLAAPRAAAESGASAAQTPAPLVANAPSLQRFRLENGLDVVLEPRPRTPRVAVVVRYHVGTRDNPSGYTGLAHTLEHMMFERTPRGRQALIPLLESIGATDVNAVTTPDYTQYVSVVPAGQLEASLWIEADRMGFLLSSLDGAQLEAQRRVVINEHRERFRGAGGNFARFFNEALFAASHPYYALSEFEEDLRALSLENVRWFHQRWYSPSNATLVLVGDFDVARVRPWIQRYFGSLASWRVPSRPAPPLPSAPAVSRIEVLAPLRSERVRVAWLTPPHFAPGDAELDILAEILGAERTGQLRRLLVRDRDSVTDLSIGQASYELVSRFEIDAIVNEGHTADEVLRDIEACIETLQRTNIDEALVRAARERYVMGVRADVGVLDRATRLAQYARADGNDADGVERDAQRYERVTPASLRQIANEWLSSRRRLVAMGRSRGSANRDGELVR